MIDCAAGCGLIHEWEDTMSRLQHDARTPLNVVLGFAQLLEAEALPPDQRESVEAIRDAGHSLLDLLEGLRLPATGQPAMVRAAGLEPARHGASEF